MKAALVVVVVMMMVWLMVMGSSKEAGPHHGRKEGPDNGIGTDGTVHDDALALFD